MHPFKICCIAFAGMLSATAAWALEPVEIVHVFQHNFSLHNDSPTGRNPDDGLTLAPDGNFYGITSHGGLSATGYADWGVIFRMTHGGEVTTLHTFDENTSAFQAGLTIGADGLLYGTKGQKVFRSTLDGDVTFIGELIGVTNDRMTLGSDGFLYGTVAAEPGSVFKMTHEGEITYLHTFASQYGVTPRGALVEGDDGYFYGAALKGGAERYGSVYRVSPEGNYEEIFSMGASSTDVRKWGFSPHDGLVKGPDGTLYGVTHGGGEVFEPEWGPNGVIYTVSNGEYSVFYNFYTGLMDMPCNCGIGSPYGGLMLASDGNFYGVANGGFSPAVATVYRMTPAGEVTSIAIIEGGNAETMLVQGNDGHLYGVARQGHHIHFPEYAGYIFRVPLEGATWGGYPIDAGRNVNTTSLIGWIYAPEDGDSWILSWDYNRWVYVIEPTENSAGAWFYFPVDAPVDQPEPGDDTWGGFIIDSTGNVNTGTLLGWIIILDDSGWVYSWTLEDWVYLPEELASESGAWGYIFR